MEAIVTIPGSNAVAIQFPTSSTSPQPTLLDLKLQLADLYNIPIDQQRIQTSGGIPLSTGNDADDEHVLLFEKADREDSAQPSCMQQQPYQIQYFGLSLRLAGGKGGFGSMLRAQGGRMSSQKTTNTDACRDLSGRRIKTVNDAKKMAEYLQKEPERAKAKKESLKRKIEEKLELADRPTRKHRFDDSKFFDEAEEQVEDVKNAVAAAIKESMRNGSTSPTSSGSSSSSSSKAKVVDVKGKGKAKDVAPVKAGKSLGMWDDMSDYESSEEEGEDEDQEEEDEEEEESEEEEEEVVVPSVGSSKSAANKGKSVKGRK